MAARWAESSVTDCVIVGAGDSVADAEGDGVALGSVAIAVKEAKATRNATTLLPFIVYDCIDESRGNVDFRRQTSAASFLNFRFQTPLLDSLGEIILVS
jgi:hypothetical protein